MILGFIFTTLNVRFWPISAGAGRLQWVDCYPSPPAVIGQKRSFKVGNKSALGDTIVLGRSAIFIKCWNQ